MHSLSNILWIVLLLVECVVGLRGTGSIVYNPQPDICLQKPIGRDQFILSVREPDFGWKEHTHRANIALRMMNYKGEDDDMKKMESQLELELTKALFRSKTTPMHESDLALFIHALLATGKNPRDFHGTDLVADLLHRVNTAADVHPFLVLALCNSHAVEFKHLMDMRHIIGRGHPENAPQRVTEDHPDIDSREAQLKAIAFKAYACAADLDSVSFNKFSEQMKDAANCLHRKYNSIDGSFGNVYTTSLAVQALVASGKNYDWWDSEKSKEFLLAESVVDVNLIKAYYIEMALSEYKFVKDLYDGEPVGRSSVDEGEKHYITYTVMPERKPDEYLSVHLNVPVKNNFFSIMEKAALLSDSFKFKFYEDKDGNPIIYSMASIPNDAEENKFWRLCRQSDVDHNRHVSQIKQYEESLLKLIPVAEEHLVYMYLDTDCPRP